MGHLEVEQHDHVLVLTMNRPEARNALSPEMLVGLADAWDRIDSDPEIRCAILTGAGGVFCSGADLKAMNATGTTSEAADRMREDSGLHWKALLRGHRLTKPLIAAVEGFALAGGTEILQATDIRVAGEGAVFGVTEVTRGLFPLGGSTVRLRRQIGYTKAMEILLIGERIPAAEAERIGLIGRVVPDGQALVTAMDIAAKIAANAPLSVQAVKKSVQMTEGLPEDEALAIELQIGVGVFGTNDAKEGTLAFKEKRPPVFTGT
ncbi:MAG TPA: crotonase/enoyl-CoA hydratase family protein [Mycobacteriales bacterium]|nr:crotonase/enoyl-CoA hydratase family protein [Mycobacteriales bacterium]